MTACIAPVWPDREDIFPNQADDIHSRGSFFLPQEIMRVFNCHSVVDLVLVLCFFLFFLETAIDVITEQKL